MNTPEENIKTILADWLDALRRHDFATLERRMDPEVFWQGVREDFVCENRDEAMETQTRPLSPARPWGNATGGKPNATLGIRARRSSPPGGTYLQGNLRQLLRGSLARLLHFRISSRYHYQTSLAEWSLGLFSCYVLLGVPPPGRR
jgi:hypothetical protein